MTYYWTTESDRGESLTVANGGYYEALERGDGTRPRPASLKGGGKVVPSSDVPELCVSATPQASLLAKVQSAQSAGTYHIYETEATPDTDATRAGLDFGLLEEYRYTMNGERTVTFSHVATVTVPETAYEHVKQAYERAADGSVDHALGESVKAGLASLVETGTYDTAPFKQAMASAFESFADAYGRDMAERAFGGVPDGVDSEQ